MDLSFLNNIYEQKLHENENHIHFWEHYLQNLDVLDFNVYAEKLTVPILVPIGSKILFRGKLKHTNEVTVALGADYFAKCSIQQAEILRKHRIQDAKSKLKQYEIEREHIQNQLSFCKQSLPEVAGHNLIEQVTEEEDKAWREKHRENVRKYKQRNDKSDEFPNSDMTDKELIDMLDELELQEEMGNEMELHESKKHINEKEPKSAEADNKFRNEMELHEIEKHIDEKEPEFPEAENKGGNEMELHESKKHIDEKVSESAEADNKWQNEMKLHEIEKHIDEKKPEFAEADSKGGNEMKLHESSKHKNESKKHIVKKKPKPAEADNKIDSDDDVDHVAKPIAGPSKKRPKKKSDRKKQRQLHAEFLRKRYLCQQPSKFELFEKVVDRHNNVKEMIAELRFRISEGLAVDDMERKLDETELKALEKEMAMLEDNCSTDYDDYIEVPEEEVDSDDEVKKSVAFADTYETKTFEITFRHSKVEPSRVPYDPKMGMNKPSDVYEACSSDFTSQTTSILKKPKSTDTPPPPPPPLEASGSTAINNENQEAHEVEVNQSYNSNRIVIRDVIEKVDCNDNFVNTNERPMSLFKKRRQQQKE